MRDLSGGGGAGQSSALRERGERIDAQLIATQFRCPRPVQDLSIRQVCSLEPTLLDTPRLRIV